MIRHTVLLRFPETTTLTHKDKLFSELRKLTQTIAGILDFHVGPNVSVEPHVMHGFNDLFWFDFVDEAARDAYLIDPEHQAIGAKLVEAVEGGLAGLIVADFKL